MQARAQLLPGCLQALLACFIYDGMRAGQKHKFVRCVGGSARALPYIPETSPPALHHRPRQAACSPAPHLTIEHAEACSLQQLAVHATGVHQGERKGKVLHKHTMMRVRCY